MSGWVVYVHISKPLGMVSLLLDIPNIYGRYFNCDSGINNNEIFLIDIR